MISNILAAAYIIGVIWYANRVINDPEEKAWKRREIDLKCQFFCEDLKAVSEMHSGDKS